MNKGIVSIEYGANNIYKNVTQIAFAKCLVKQNLKIPAYDIDRTLIFGDPIVGVVKHILIRYNNGEKQTFNNGIPIDVNINMNMKSNVNPYIIPKVNPDIKKEVTPHCQSCYNQTWKRS